MSEAARLRQSLGKLAAPGEVVGQGRRRLRGGTADALIAALLCEVDETILARALTFETDDGRDLTVEAYNRRLIRLVPPAPAGTTADLAKLFGETLTSATDDTSSRTYEFLLRFFKAAKTVTVKSAAPAAKIDATQLGPLATHLAEAWNLSATGPGVPGHAIERFVKLLDEVATAWLWRGEDGVRSSSGDTAAIADLQTDLEAWDDATGGDPMLETTLPGPGGPGGRLRAQVGSHTLAADVDAAAAEALMDRWRTLGL
jgi:hypothetical protein